MITTRDIVLGFAAPVLLAVLAALVAGKFRQGWLIPIFIALACAVAFFGIELGAPAFPPHNVEGWLAYLMVPAAVIGVLENRMRLRLGVRAMLAIVLFGAAAGLILWPLQHALSLLPILVWVAVLSVGQTLWWLLMDALPDATSRPLVPALLGLTAAAVALDLLNTGQIEFGKLAGMLALVLWVLAATDLWTKSSSLTRSGTIVICLFLWGLLTVGHFYGDITWRDFVLLTLAPLTAWTAGVPPIRNKGPWVKLAVAMAPVLVLLAIPAIPAAMGLRQTMLQETEVAFSAPVTTIRSYKGFEMVGRSLRRSFDAM